METKPMSFEDSMKRLDEIVKTLESGNVSLEESIALFEEGTKLSASCSKQLEDAKLKVRMLAEGPDGALVEKDFDNGIEEKV